MVIRVGVFGSIASLSDLDFGRLCVGARDTLGFIDMHGKALYGLEYGVAL